MQKDIEVVEEELLEASGEPELETNASKGFPLLCFAHTEREKLKLSKVTICVKGAFNGCHE